MITPHITLICSSDRRVNLVKWLISIAIMLRIVCSTLSLIGSGWRSIVPATNGSQRVCDCNPLNWTENCEEVQKKIINSNPNLFNHTFNATSAENLRQHTFLQWTTPIARSLRESCTWYHLRILIKALLCCDWKGCAVSAQSFTLWQLAAIEIPSRAHSISTCSRHIYCIWMLVFMPEL